MEEALATEYYQLKQQEKAIMERLAKLRDALTKKTGKRRAGAFMVNVGSWTKEIMDQEAARGALVGAGIAVPMKSTPQVRLTVEPWVDLLGVETVGAV